MAIQTISVQKAYELLQGGTLLIDVREPDEWAKGIAKGAKPFCRSDLEKNPCHQISSFDQPVLLMCAGGKRSDACALALQTDGYQNLYSIEGGINSWKLAGLPIENYQTSDFDLRYSRQMQLPNVGRAGQEKLAAARVLIVGAGGLGSPASFYLAAAGVGHITIIDNDNVDLSNLQRQILHKNSNIGESKVSSAKNTLNALNPSISIEIHNDAIDENNIINYLKNIDLVIDGTDNFASRYAISDACTLLGIPWIYGAVYRFEGQVSLFHASQKDGRGGCYRCLFPLSESQSTAQNCTEAGVLGVAPGIIGLLQATEALKHLIGIGESLQGRLLTFDLLSMKMHETKLLADPQCISCKK
jgi:molybdopterin/thiamine biosynthesis adenylyltransferase/rhodanese-related sulfurtransferase